MLFLHFAFYFWCACIFSHYLRETKSLRVTISGLFLVILNCPEPKSLSHTHLGLRKAPLLKKKKTNLHCKEQRSLSEVLELRFMLSGKTTLMSMVWVDTGIRIQPYVPQNDNISIQAPKHHISKRAFHPANIFNRLLLMCKRKKNISNQSGWYQFMYEEIASRAFLYARTRQCRFKPNSGFWRGGSCQNLKFINPVLFNLGIFIKWQLMWRSFYLSETTDVFISEKDLWYLDS